MKLNRFFKLFFLVLLVSTFAPGPTSHADMRPAGQGLPLPWPFPWAKECPINWQSLQGRYFLSDSQENDQIDLKISVLDRYGFKVVRVSRYSSDGKVLADGFAFLRETQRSIGLWLYPARRGDSPAWAELKMYHGSATLTCDEKALVPILSLDRVENTNHTQIRYRLVRVPNSHY